MNLRLYYLNTDEYNPEDTSRLFIETSVEINGKEVFINFPTKEFEPTEIIKENVSYDNGTPVPYGESYAMYDSGYAIDSFELVEIPELDLKNIEIDKRDIGKINDKQLNEIIEQVKKEYAKYIKEQFTMYLNKSERNLPSFEHYIR